MRRRFRTSLLLLALGGTAAAHSISPEAIVGELTAEKARSTWGVERAARDDKVPRLLVIRVGPRWYEHSRAARAEQAELWQRTWHHSVPQGVVAVLDDRTDRPVVRFGPGGTVSGVSDAPAR